MATYANQFHLYVQGRHVKIGPTDNLEMGGTFTAQSFTGSGANLTNLPANQIVGTGLLPDLVLSPNIPRKNAVSNVFLGDLTINGALTVNGAVYAVTPTSVLVGNNFIELLAGNTSTNSVQAGGFTVIPKAVGTPVQATAFVAGVGSVSNPVISVASNPTTLFAVGDIISVSGSTDAKNDGIYAVQGLSASTITVKGIGISATHVQTPFLHNQFIAQTGQNATVTRIGLAVIAFSNGALEGVTGPITEGTPAWAYAGLVPGSHAKEIDFVGSWASLGGAGTLQAAYAGGNTIVMTSVRGALDVYPGNLQTAAIKLKGNANSYLVSEGAELRLGGTRVNLTDGPVVLDKSLMVSAGDTSVVALTAGDICYVDALGIIRLSDGDSLTYGAREVDGVYGGLTGLLATGEGTRVAVKYTGAAPVVGQMLFLSGVAGRGTRTLPTTGRVTRLGKVVAAGNGTTCEIIWKPQYVIDL